MSSPPSSPPSPPETYLGDGVYAVFDGWHIRLDLRNQDASRIALEPEVLLNLIAFAQEVGIIKRRNPDD